jgi:peptidoglycan hydrolase CwlO-like protein
MKQKILGCILIVVLLAQLLPVWGSETVANTDSLTSQQLREKLNELNRDIANTQGELDATRRQMYEIEREILLIDIEMYRVTSELITLEDALEDTLERLARNEAELENARADRDGQIEDAQRRLRVIYEQGQMGMLEIIFQATSITDFLSRIEMVNSIAARDRQMIADLEAAEVRYEQAVTNTQHEQRMLIQLQEAHQRQLSELEEVLIERYIFFAVLEEVKAYHEAMLGTQYYESHNLIAALNEALANEQRIREIEA